MSNEQIIYWASMLNESMSDKASDDYLNEGVFKNIAKKVADAGKAVKDTAKEAGHAVAKKMSDMNGAFANKSVKDLATTLGEMVKKTPAVDIKIKVSIEKVGDFGGDYPVIDVDLVKSKLGRTLILNYDTSADPISAKTLRDYFKMRNIKKMTSSLIGIALTTKNEKISGIIPTREIDSDGDGAKDKKVTDAVKVKTEDGEMSYIQDNKYLGIKTAKNVVWLYFKPTLDQQRSAEADNTIFS